MKRKIVVLLLIITFSLSLAFAQNVTRLSVPLGHRAYTLLRQAEIRGLIARLPRVTPYQTTFVVAKLDEIRKQSNLLSQSEIELLQGLLSEFHEPLLTDNNIKQILSVGKVSFESEKHNLRTQVGAYGKIDLRVGIESQDPSFLYDSRNALTAFFVSDVGSTLSVDMNAILRLDKLDNRLFNPNAFTIPAEGFYLNFIDLKQEVVIPMTSFMAGFSMQPEIALGFFDEKLLFRFASVKRDWGVGLNNIQLSGSAREFSGFESTLNLSSWLRHHFIVGSLGKFNLDSNKIGDKPFPSDRLHQNAYNNNYSAHRVEVDIPRNITLAIWEAIVWQKRFDISYLNPFTIFMQEQSQLGDFDNMVAGVDAQWLLPGVLRLYGAWGMSEMNEVNPKRFLKHPRNIMAFQAGIDFVLPVGSFSNATVQYTYLSPFFYTHAPAWNIWDPSKHGQNVSYVNKGENLGYPLDPNSDEILLNIDIGLSKGWRVLFETRYQRRSGQYGYTIEMFCSYTAADQGLYEYKAFNANLIEERISAEIQIEKKLKDFPLTISCSYSLLLERHKEHVSDVTYGNSDPKPVLQSTWSPHWSNPSFTHVLALGVTIYR